MTKKDAIALFGSLAATARSLGISRSAVSQWPDKLPQRIADRVLGAKYRVTNTPAKRSRAQA